MVFGTLNSEKIWHANLTDLSTSHVRSTLPWEIQKSHFQQYYSYVILIIYVTSEDRKLSYRRGTARCFVSVEILPIATQHCSTTSPEQIEVITLEG